MCLDGIVPGALNGMARPITTAPLIKLTRTLLSTANEEYLVLWEISYRQSRLDQARRSA